MPGTAPTGWKTPKTSYTADDVLTPQQFERIEGNAYATELGARTIDPSQSPTGVIGHLRNFLDWFANRIKAILGTTNWHDAPPTTLTAAKSHIDAAAPHSGHETPTGAQAKVDAHASVSAPHSGHATTTALNNHTSATNAHSATSAATANRIIRRDTAGRAKVATPSASDDISTKGYVDAKFDPSTGHNHDGTEGNGPKIPVSGLAGWLAPVSARANADLTLQSNDVASDVPGATATLGPGKWLVIGVFDICKDSGTTDGTCSGLLVSGGVQQSGAAVLDHRGNYTYEIARASVTQTWLLSLAANTIVKLQAIKNGGGFTVRATNTSLTAIWLSL